MTEVALAPGQHALVGYGSLLSVASMEGTLGHRYAGPFHVVRVNGWRRGWDVQMPKSKWTYQSGDRQVLPDRVLYLNVRREEGSHINAALFVVDSAALAGFDEREWIYDRVAVNADLADVRVTGGQAWMYVARAEYLWRKSSHPPQAIIRRSYLDILDTAHAQLGDGFRREYDATTDPAPPQLIVRDTPI